MTPAGAEVLREGRYRRAVMRTGRQTRVRTGALVAVVTVASMLAACSGDGATRREGASRRPGEPSTAAPPTTTVPSATTLPTTTTLPLVDKKYALGVRTETFVDPTRPTSAAGAFPGTPDRAFPVTIWYPTAGLPDAPTAGEAPPNRSGGPYPLVLFAHGWAVPPEFFAELLVRWAAAGYVVAAPAYPLLSGIPAGPSHADYGMSFADTTFVLTQLLRMFGGPAGSHPLAGLIDPERIAAAGHSDGQAIAYGIGFLVCCRDPRFKAVVAMAGDLGNINNPVQRDNGVPVLHVVSERDEYNGYTSSLRWDREVLTAPKWSVTLVAAPHTAPFVDPRSPYFEGVEAMTVDFLDATLKGRPERADRIAALAAARPDLYRMND